MSMYFRWFVFGGLQYIVIGPRIYQQNAAIANIIHFSKNILPFFIQQYRQVKQIIP